MKKQMKISLLDENGIIPSHQLPSYVDDVVEGLMNDDNTEFYDINGETIIPEIGKIYVDTTENKSYRWDETKYIVIASHLALGESAENAYPGNKGKKLADKIGVNDISQIGETVTYAIVKLNEDKVSNTGNTKDNIVSFSSEDETDSSLITSWEDVSILTTNEKHSSILNKISKIFKNVRYLYKMIGNTDISSIGDGSLTTAIDEMNSNLSKVANSNIFKLVEPKYTGIKAYPNYGNKSYTIEDDVIEGIEYGGYAWDLQTNIGEVYTISLTNPKYKKIFAADSITSEEGISSLTFIATEPITKFGILYEYNGNISPQTKIQINTGAEAKVYEKYNGKGNLEITEITNRLSNSITNNTFCGKNIFNPLRIVNSGTFDSYTKKLSDDSTSFSVFCDSDPKIFYKDSFKENQQYTISFSSAHSLYGYGAGCVVTYTDGTTESFNTYKTVGVDNIGQREYHITQKGKTISYLNTRWYSGTVYFKDFMIEEGITDVHVYEDPIKSPKSISNEIDTIVSDKWDCSTTYEVGSYCIYDNTFWRCKVGNSNRIPSPGDYWEKINIGKQLTALEKRISSLESK